MKIGIASPIYLSTFSKFLNHDPDSLQFGFGGTSVNSLILGLLQLGHQVSVYTLDHKVDADHPLVFEGKNLKVYVGQYNKAGRVRMMTLFNKEINQIKNFITQDKPDIVNAHWTYEFALGAIRSKYPHLLTFRDDSWEILKFFKDPYRIIRLLLDLNVRVQGKFFNVNSYYLKDKLSGFKKELPVIPNPIDETEIVDKPKKHPQKTFKIISILTGWERKNPENALKAFAKIRHKYKEKVEYYLIGRCYGPDEKAYHWAKERGLADGVHFVGITPHSETLKSLAECDILLHPALEESFGNTLIEAMAKGLPVIAGRTSGAVPWVLNYGKNGMLVDVLSPESMAEAIENLIISPKLYEKLSSEGIKYVKNFSSSKVASRYIELYNKILTQQNTSQLNYHKETKV
jgi:L-malate glycosyltransferase